MRSLVQNRYLIYYHDIQLDIPYAFLSVSGLSYHHLVLCLVFFVVYLLYFFLIVHIEMSKMALLCELQYFNLEMKCHIGGHPVAEAWLVQGLVLISSKEWNKK